MSAHVAHRVSFLGGPHVNMRAYLGRHYSTYRDASNVRATARTWRNNGALILEVIFFEFFLMQDVGVITLVPNQWN